MLELVRRRVPHHREVGLVLVEDVLDHRLMACSPVQALLDVRLLADDPGLHDREVGSRGSRELLRQVFGEVAGEPGFRPARPTGDRSRDRRVEQPHLGEVPGQLFDLHEHAGRHSVERASGDLHLHVAEHTLGQVGDSVGTALARREQHLVVVDLAVVRGVVDVCVQAVLVDAEVEDAQAHLLRRAERLRCSGPAGCIDRLRSGEGSLSGESGRVVELEAERGDEGRVVVRADVVRRHAAPGEEALEVDGRAVDRADAAARPLDLGDLLAAALGGLREGLGLENARVERRGAVPERRSVDVEGVVRRAVHAGPRTGREAVPARARVRRRLREEPLAAGLGARLEELRDRRHRLVRRVVRGEILAHAVGDEEDRGALSPAQGRSRRLRRRRPSDARKDSEYEYEHEQQHNAGSRAQHLTLPCM